MRNISISFESFEGEERNIGLAEHARELFSIVSVSALSLGTRLLMLQGAFFAHATLGTWETPSEMDLLKVKDAENRESTARMFHSKIFFVYDKHDDIFSTHSVLDNSSDAMVRTLITLSRAFIKPTEIGIKLHWWCSRINEFYRWEHNKLFKFSNWLEKLKI